MALSWCLINLALVGLSFQARHRTQAIRLALTHAVWTTLAPYEHHEAALPYRGVALPSAAAFSGSASSLAST
ncbi:hypothetical protein [Paraliomyxa miuraensis]|uniref:hypothetical protein n=1 Tax=Paraliomyxa miuraensis TaxID=376150 RepID=UPI00225C0ED9|nr:hypothetical protein [Paraliomyxa miuraensis]MCX4239397.1 hypothetical protein [Paraliomyxa miuraensis]